MLLPHLVVLAMLMTSHDVSGLAVCTAVAVTHDSTSSVTNVTCQFGESISEKNFNVQFFPRPGSDPEIALVCNRQGAELLCKKGKGVVFEEKQRIAHGLTLTRSSSQQLSPGAQYQCQAVPQLGGPSQRCDALIIHMSSMPTPHIDPGQRSSSALDVAIFLFLMLIIIVLVVVVVVGYRCRFRIRRWCLGPVGERWPGVVKDPENPPKAEDPKEENREQSLRLLAEGVSVPEGLPQFFYNLGVEAAGEKKKEEEKHRGSATNDSITEEPAGPGKGSKNRSEGKREGESPGKEREKESKKGCHIM